MIILGIDPGPETSGICLYNSNTGRVEEAWSAMANDDVIEVIAVTRADAVAIEHIHNQGRAVVGQSTFSTCVWAGQFCRQAIVCLLPAKLILRSAVKMHICGTMRAKDANIAQALRDKLGGKGTRAQPGPTYGVSGHAWQALAVAVVYAESNT